MANKTTNKQQHDINQQTYRHSQVIKLEVASLINKKKQKFVKNIELKVTNYKFCVGIIFHGKLILPLCCFVCANKVK